MTLSNIDKLGKEIGHIKSDQTEIKENISPDETVDQDQIVSIERMPIGGTFVATAYYYPDDSFILDHPVYGDLDSSTLALDGGYATGNQFALTFPISFAQPKLELYRTTF